MTIVQENPFDAIRKTGDNGAEFWSARELMGLLGYSRWSDFRDTLSRGEAACKNSGQEVAGHFSGLTLKSQGRPAEDVSLSRYAAYLVAMNGDPRKPEIASAQTYFAIKTRQAEVAAQQPTSRPALISARLVALALDCSSKSAGNRLRHRGIDPTDHLLDPICGAPAYLYPLAEVQKVWPAVSFQPYTGLVHAGTGEVEHRTLISKQGKAERNQHLFFTVAEELGAQLAREMVETFIRDELPKRFRAVFGSQVSA
jgi:hypothetical protein